MGEVNQTYKNRVLYELYHKDYGTDEITAPENWDDDEKEFARNKNYHGIFTKFSNNLRFIEDGADWIRTVRKLYGINAEIRLTKKEMDPQTDEWVTSYVGFLDLAEYSYEDKKVGVKFNASGLEKTIKARETEKIEIERRDTLKGREIPELATRNLQLDGREILLQSLFDVSDGNNGADVVIASNAGNTRSSTCTLPLRIVSNSHQGLLNQPVPQTNGTETTGNLDMMFLFDMDRERHFNIDIRGTLDAFVQQYENVQWAFYKICLTKYENGFDFDMKERIELYDLGSNHPWFGDEYDYVMPQFTQTCPFNYANTNFTLLEGESAALEVIVKADFFVDNNAGIRVFAQDIIGTHPVDPLSDNEPVIVHIKEESYDDPTNTKVVLAHELVDRLATIISNQDNAVYSKLLGRTDIGYAEDGEGSLSGFAHGFWIRQFDLEPQNDENKYQKFTTTWKDAYESLAAIHGVGLGIEKIGFRERVRIEDERYFYNNNILIRLPYQVKKLKRTTAKDWFFNSINIGFLKGGEYEEAMGLDEYNTQSTWTTVIEAIKKQFRRLSKYRADGYGIEFARRKSIFNNPTEDTKYDKDIFGFDMKRDYSNFKQRVWQDDFDNEPTGVFSPSTAPNLRWSPSNLLRKKHAWIIASGLIAYPMDYIRFGSSTANSKLTTKFIGEPEYAENEPEIINTEMGRARIDPEYIEFEHQVDFGIMQQLEGFTELLGEKVPNVYGLVEFINDEGNLETGFLINLKPNKEGKWKLLKSNFKA